jgi:hypothetical protein
MRGEFLERTKHEMQGCHVGVVRFVVGERPCEGPGRYVGEVMLPEVLTRAPLSEVLVQIDSDEGPRIQLIEHGALLPNLRVSELLDVGLENPHRESMHSTERTPA